MCSITSVLHLPVESIPLSSISWAISRVFNISSMLRSKPAWFCGLGNSPQKNIIGNSRITFYDMFTKWPVLKLLQNWKISNSEHICKQVVVKCKPRYDFFFKEKDVSFNEIMYNSLVEQNWRNIFKFGFYFTLSKPNKGAFLQPAVVTVLAIW